jgi:hypothetical protein
MHQPIRRIGFLKRKKKAEFLTSGNKSNVPIAGEAEEVILRSVVVSSKSDKKLSLPTAITQGLKISATTALVDCGAEGRFIDKSVVDFRKATRLDRPIRVWNIDGTINRSGQITHKVWVEYSFKGNTMKNWFFITSLGDQTMVLGMPWLREYNLHID